MRKILPILLASVVYLTPLYPVYAQSNIPKRPLAATKAGILKTQVMDGISDQKIAREEKMATRAAALKAKLAKFKDKAKASRVDAINNNLSTVNEKRTNQMQSALDKIAKVLEKLKTWASEQEAAGKDMTEINQIIADTESAWDLAQAAVTDQVDNDYTIVVNTETTVKEDAKVARDKLHTDLKAVHDKLVSVRQTLASALGRWKGGK